MFDKYPKNRPVLPEAYKKIYKTHYKANRDGNTRATNLAQKMESWMHKKTSNDVNFKHSKDTLEIGAGTLNQLGYEIPENYDIIEPFKELYKNSNQLSLVKNRYTDIDDIDFSKKYDRIISIATFEHILDLPKVIAKSAILLKEDGSLRVSIPNEGTFLWKLGWKLTTGIEFKIKYGLDYEVLMKHEHVNTADEIDSILSYFFNEIKMCVYGVNKNIGFYRFYECKKPKKNIALKYIKDYFNSNDS